MRQGARLVHVPSGQRVPCHCADASAGGARLLLPARTPVAVGHEVQVVMPESAARHLPELGGPNVNARVVRVDRESLLTAGQITVGVVFEAV